MDDVAKETSEFEGSGLAVKSARDVEARRASAERYKARERSALLGVAAEVLGDPRAEPAEREIARRRIAGRDLADVPIDTLTERELETLGALLDKLIEGTTHDVDLVVVAEPKPVYVPPPCAECTARNDRVFVEITDFDESTRANIVEGINELRQERTQEAA